MLQAVFEAWARVAIAAATMVAVAALLHLADAKSTLAVRDQHADAKSMHAILAARDHLADAKSTLAILVQKQLQAAVAKSMHVIHAPRRAAAC